MCAARSRVFPTQNSKQLPDRGYRLQEACWITTTLCLKSKQAGLQENNYFYSKSSTMKLEMSTQYLHRRHWITVALLWNSLIFEIVIMLKMEWHASSQNEIKKSERRPAGYSILFIYLHKDSLVLWIKWYKLNLNV
jgi:hypothetical protein